MDREGSVSHIGRLKMVRRGERKELQSSRKP